MKKYKFNNEKGTKFRTYNLKHISHTTEHKKSKFLRDGAKKLGLFKPFVKAVKLSWERLRYKNEDIKTSSKQKNAILV